MDESTDRDQYQSEDNERVICSVNEKKGRSTKRIRSSILSIFSYCPYTMLGKTIIRFLRGEKDLPHEPLTSNERYVKSKTTFGVGIILIGIFCPIFWISLITGAQGDELLRSGINSLMVVLFGILYIGYYRVQSQKKVAQGKTKERTWLEDE
jgi:hypothetical protein